MGSLFANSKAMKCGLPDIIQVGILLAKSPKPNSLHAAAASLRSMDPVILTWELVANRLVAEHKTLIPKPGNYTDYNKRKGRQKKNVRTTMILLLMKGLIENTLRTLRAVALVLKGKKKVISRLRLMTCLLPFKICGKAGHWVPLVS
jgi:hypothetical protein